MMAFTACSSDDDDKSVVNVSESDLVGMWYNEESEFYYKFNSNNSGTAYFYDEEVGADVIEEIQWTLSGAKLICRWKKGTETIVIKSYNKNELRLVDDEGDTIIWTRVSDDFGE